MKMRQLLLAIFSLLVGWGTAGVAQAAPTVTFEAGDTPGNFFICTNTGPSSSLGCANGITPKQKSLAVIRPGETVGFSSAAGEASTIHTAVSLIWPTGATHDGGTPFATTPFKVPVDFLNPAPGGVAEVKLDTPGLYVFICDIHVYMFAGVIVDDSDTPGLDLGASITLVNNPAAEVPTTSNLAARLLRTFFIITDPDNWLDYSNIGSEPNYHVTYPGVPVQAGAAFVPNLHDYLSTMVPGIENDQPKAGLFNPGTPAIGEIWVNTQFELTAGKSKPGTATAINGADWTITKKIALPTRNMNHPHNMWTDQDQSVIYQTQWFSERMSVFNRTTGAWKYDLPTGPAPSHVMTRANNDLVHVAQNGGNNVREFDTLKNNNLFIADIPMKVYGPGEVPGVDFDAHPHGHWMSADGNKMVTPNENVGKSTVYNFPGGAIEATVDVGHTPIATGMMPDSSKYYVANLLDHTISVIDMETKAVKTINLLNDTLSDPPGPGTNKYDALTGAITGSVGALPIQTPVSPDGTNMVTANAITGTITVVDTRPGSPNEDQVVAMLPCDPGCHGVNYGAKEGGGYYAYVSSKFSNALIVVNPDPDGDGDPSKATVVGRILLAGPASAVQDDTVLDNNGMGGQGVLPVPLAYNGWVQQWVQKCNTRDCKAWRGQLTDEQKNPGPLPNQRPGRGNR